MKDDNKESTKNIEQKAKRFHPKKLHKDKIKEHLDIDLYNIYDKAFNELGLQQAKRDQLVTIYLAFLALVVPLCLKSEGSSLNRFAIGWVFFAAAVIGAIFSVIIIRYRVYKEAYWLCCQTITTLMNLKPEALTKEVIQTVYYKTLMKKSKKFLVRGNKCKKCKICKKCTSKKERTEKVLSCKRRKGKFSVAKYVKEGFFSAETLYYLIVVLLTGAVAGMSIGCLIQWRYSILSAIVVGALVVLLLMRKYFHECIKIYKVSQDGLDSSFNIPYAKAWFLHFFN